MIYNPQKHLNMNTAHQTAHAFITVYKALPDEVREEVKHLILEMDQTGQPGHNTASLRKHLTDRLRANPVSIPATFQFNREEANER